MSAHKQRVETFLGRIAARVRQSAAEGLYDSTRELIQELPVDRRVREVAVRGWRNVRAGRELDAGAVDAVESWVIPLHRPVLDVIEDTFNDPQRPWDALWRYRETITQVVRATGVVRVWEGNQAVFCGSAVLVGPGLAMTNRHVAQFFVQGVGMQVTPVQGRRAEVIFNHEVWQADALTAPVVRVRLVHPYWDLALIELDTSGEVGRDRMPLKMWGMEPPFLEDRTVMTVGHPTLSADMDTDLQQEFFGGHVFAKRLMPGAALGTREVAYGDQVIQVLTTDCATMGVNSGAAVMDLDTGKLVGLHLSSAYLDATFAIPTWALAQDDHLIRQGLTFEPRAQSAQAPVWLSAWDAVAQPSAPAAPTSGDDDGWGDVEADALGDGAPGAGFGDIEEGDQLEVGGNWYERISDEMLVRALAQRPNATRALLEDALGPDQATEIIRALADAESAGALPDAALPELVLVPASMGSHLVHLRRLERRFWLEPKGLVRGACVEGFDPEQIQARPDGLVRHLYGRAARMWRQAGFAVHTVPYDWRRGLELASLRLGQALDRLAVERPNRPLVLVAHGMGGLAACLYASRDSRWSARVARVIFVGVPLAGTFEAIEAAWGAEPVLAKLGALQSKLSSEQLRALGASVPGWLEALPDPTVFPDATDFYGLRAWPEGARPGAQQLGRSRALKPALRRSPLAEVAELIVSADHATVDGVDPSEGGGWALGSKDAPGDGVVALRSSLPEGRRAWVCSSTHRDMLRDPEVIQAVIELAQLGVCRLDTIERGDTRAARRLTPPDVMRYRGAALDALRVRLDEGSLTSADVLWLMAPDRATLPPS